MPDALMLCFARLIRWAIVASGTRNAPVISAVLRPPTARSVSAIAEAGVSVGCAHMNISTRPLGGRGEQRLLHRVLAVAEVAEATHDRGEDPRRRFAQQVLDAWRSAHLRPSGSGASITSRTSIGCLIGTPPRAGAAETLAAISIARAGDSTSTSR